MAGIASQGTLSFSEGGGIENSLFGPDTTLAIANSLVAENTAATGPDFNGPAAQTDSNLIGNASGATGFSALASDLLGTTLSPINPVLGPLQNNAGNVPTLAPLPGSPALGAGDSFADNAVGLTTDARGLARVVAGSVDIGAYQTQAELATTTTLATTSNSLNVGNSVTFTATVAPVTTSTAVPTGLVTFEANIGGTIVTLGTAPLVGGQAAFQSLSLPVGTSNVSAVYSGDATFNGSSSVAQTEIVTDTSVFANDYTALPTVADSNSTAAGNLRTRLRQPIPPPDWAATPSHFRRVRTRLTWVRSRLPIPRVP